MPRKFANKSCQYQESIFVLEYFCHRSFNIQLVMIMKRSRWDFLRCHLLKGRKGSLSVHPTVVELKAQRIPERDAQNKNKIDDVIKIEEQRNPAINKDHHTGACQL
ncbi:unnamed protein product [Musa textilis]